MNRLYLACGLAFAALTVAAYVDHARHRDAPKPSPEEAPRVTSAPAGAGTSAPDAVRPTPQPRPPAMDRAAVLALLEERVRRPIAEQFTWHARVLSRTALADPKIEIVLDEDDVRPPREDGHRVVLFTVVEHQPVPDGETRRETLALGRLDTGTRLIELAARARGHGPMGGFETLAKGLSNLGVDVEAPAGVSRER